MRLTQLGHQVPRRNSTIVGPRCRISASEKLPGRFAAFNVKFGALSPTFNVSEMDLSLKQRSVCWPGIVQRYEHSICVATHSVHAEIEILGFSRDGPANSRTEAALRLL
jgi:hypothetical protein